MHDNIELKEYKSALKLPKWKQAIDEEMQALKLNDTWKLVPRPTKMNIVGSKWIFKIKYKEDGLIER